MKKLLSTFLFSFCLTMLAQAQLVITEIMYDSPESGTDSLEYIEIYNNSATAIDMNGYHIIFGNAVRDSFSGSFILPAGSLVVTTVNASAVRNQFNLSFTPRQWRTGTGLSNNNGIIKLKNATGLLIDSVSYTNGWVPTATTQKTSIILCDVNSDNNIAASWAASTAVTGRTINGLALKGSPGVLETCSTVTPPANDNCAGATLLTQNATCTPITGDVANATQSLAACDGDAEDDVWYKFVATGTSAIVTVVGSTDFDAVLEVRSGACAAGTSLACEDNDADGGTEVANLTTLTVGQTYYVRVHDYYATPPPTTTFTICVTYPATAPANDNCAGAFNLTAAATCTPLTGTVAGATQSLAGCSGVAGDDVWFRFTATTPSINLTVAGSGSFDAVVEVFSGTCAAATSINCTDNDGDRGGTEVANLSGLTVGNTYFVRVYDYYTPAPTTPTFTICAQEFTQCNLTAPIGAILEGEACGDSTNNGCANVAPTYGNISCGQTVFGNAWADGGSRDLDYYSFTVGAGDTVHLNVNAEFPALIAIVSIPLNDCDDLNIINSATMQACTPTNLATYLATPGTYYVVIMPSVFTGFACGTNNDYIASLSIGTANTIATTTTAASCAVGGSATATVSGSAAPYTYLWSNTQTGQTATGLAAGTYMVTATNANSCRVMATATVASSAITVTATPSSTPTTCGVGTGTATVAPTNGVAPYTYLWSGARTGSTITGLTAGNYNVSITDANGCMGIVNAINVANPNAPTATISSTNIACFGNNTGAATISATGGTAPYSFVWSNSTASTNVATGLVSGSFTVTINDANNCATTINGNITAPAAITAVVSATAASAAGSTDGAADLTVTGGVAPFAYAWSNGATTEDISGLAAGTYTVTITDANNCTANASVTISQPVGVINATAEAMSLRLFPNPAQQTATLELSVLSASQVNIEIYNVTGQVLYSQNAEQIGTQQYQIPVADFAQGIYFVKVRAANNTATQRLIISRD